MTRGDHDRPRRWLVHMIAFLMRHTGIKWYEVNTAIARAFPQRSLRWRENLAAEIAAVNARKAPDKTVTG